MIIHHHQSRLRDLRHIGAYGLASTSDGPYGVWRRSAREAQGRRGGKRVWNETPVKMFNYILDFSCLACITLCSILYACALYSNIVGMCVGSKFGDMAVHCLKPAEAHLRLMSPLDSPTFLLCQLKFVTILAWNALLVVN